MMVETILDSSQDFGMSNGSLPQWKRELLQRRAARGRGAPPSAPPAPPAPAAPADEDEELCYGPGIVKRLKSRYLSLALREAARRRPSVLRRAASLEHVLEERPRPRPRPASLAAPAPLPQPSRRDSVKRARSVDALSRLDSREEPEPAPVPPPAPRPPVPRAARPPRRPAPLLRDTERPPPDVVRSALRKFESAPARRAAPAARVSAVLRGLEGARRSITPDRSEGERSPSPQPEAAPPTEPPPPPPADSPPPAPVLRPAPSPPIRLVPVTPTAPVPTVVAPVLPVPTIVAPVLPVPTVVAPGLPVPTVVAPVLPVPTVVAPVLPVPTVIAPVSPVPAPVQEVAPPTPAVNKTPEKIERATTTPSPIPTPSPRALSPSTNTDEAGNGSVRVVSRAALEGIARAGSSVRYEFGSRGAHSHLPPLGAANPVLARRVGVIRPMPASPEPARVNGHSTPEPRALSRIGAAGIERAWSGSPRVSPPVPPAAPWARGGRGRAPPPATTSVVFNFSNRKEVPDYIENDGIILRASRRNMIKAGEAGVVVLRPELLAAGEESEEEADGGPPSPCAVRFVNDNVLINGRSSMLRDPTRTTRLKLQFDDSLTRTFEYPSETSLCEESPCEESPAPAPAPAPAAPPPAPPASQPPADQPQQSLVENTHIASAALSRYTPCKSAPASFQLGLAAPARPSPAPATHPAPEPRPDHTDETDGECEAVHAVPCGADVARAWSDARRATDLLF